MRPKVILITGATATGKTDVAARLARYFHTAIISADSRQCYRELNIGTAKPPEALLREIPHYFINSHHITDQVNAAVFEQFALGCVKEIFRKNQVVLLCGGSGMYIRAFCEGLDEIPAIPARERLRLRGQYTQLGLSWLQKEISIRDPKYCGSGDLRNPHRLLRALEVILATGKSITEFRKGVKAFRDFDLIRIGLSLPPEILKERISIRVEQMAEAGLREEAENLLPNRMHNALQTVGYSEVFDFLDGEIGWDKCLELIRAHTWQYARRQNTWLKKDKELQWIDARDEKNIFRIAEAFSRE